MISSLLRFSAGAALAAALTAARAQQPPVPTPPDQPPPPPAATQPPAPAPDAPARIKPLLSAATVSPGEGVVLSYRLDSARGLEDYPRSIEVDGLGIRFAGVSSQQLFNNGSLVRYIELRYLIEAETEGQYTIPPQTFTVDGQTITSEAATLTVKEGAAPIDGSMMPQVQLSASRTEIWKGELVPITVTVLMHPAVQIASQIFPTITSEGFAVARFDRIPSLDLQDVGSETWRVYRAQSVMSAMKPGKLTLGPAEVKADVLMPMAGGLRDPFGGMPSSRRSLKLRSNGIDITVKDLPPDKPSTFAGAVGQFTIMARADNPGAPPWQVNLGDPVAFEIAIAGSGNFDSVGNPTLENPEGFRTYPAKVSMENRDWGSEPGEKRFTQLVFPEKSGSLKAVYSLSFFNPSSGKYETVRTDPLELIVTGQPPSEGTGASAGTTTESARDFSLLGTPAPSEDIQDILPQLLPQSPLRPLYGSVLPAPAGWWHAAPAAAAALLFAAGSIRRNKAARLASQPPPGSPRPCRDILADLRKPNLTGSEFYALVSEYLTAWSHHRKSPLPNHPDLAAVLARRDFWRYASPGNADSPVPADERSRALQILPSVLPS